MINMKESERGRGGFSYKMVSSTHIGICLLFTISVLTIVEVSWCDSYVSHQGALAVE
jgi:hypothetical protein